MMTREELRACLTAEEVLEAKAHYDYEMRLIMSGVALLHGHSHAALNYMRHTVMIRKFMSPISAL